MAMTPDEIRAKTFPTVKKGGADLAVVEAFLTEVADEINRLRREADDIRADLAKSEAAATSEANPASREPPISVVGSHVDELLGAAQRSAEAIVRDAEDWATAKKGDADTYAQQVRSQVDELRSMTEQQAESFREETVEYAARIRDDAESSAKSIVETAEADASAQYEARSRDVTSRWEAVKSAERALLISLDETTADFSKAKDFFEQAVSNHDSGTIGPDDTPAAEHQEPTVVSPVQTDPSESVEDASDASESADDEADADVGHDDAAAAEPTPGFYDAADEDNEDAPAGATPNWGDPAEPTDADPWSPEETTDQPDMSDDAVPSGWEVDPEGDPASQPSEPQEAEEAPDVWPTETTDSDSPWGAAERSTSDAWGDDNTEAASTWGNSSSEGETTDTWSDAGTDESPWGTPGADGASTDEGTTPAVASSWEPGPVSDPWASDVPADSSADLVTSEEVSQPTDDNAFFDGSTDDSETAADPLATMVREAVDRVTDGDGSN